jgi:hypothetical protein
MSDQRHSEPGLDEPAIDEHAVHEGRSREDDGRGDDQRGEPVLCDFLRAKVSGAAHGDKRALLAIQHDASSVYWCLLTMSPAGPDDGLAHAERCGEGRVCCTQRNGGEVA